MRTVNMLDARTQLSKLVEAVESGAESEIIIARNGKPAARLVAVATEPRAIRLGLAKGKFEPWPYPDPLDEVIAKMFEDSEIFPSEKSDDAA